MLCQGAPCSGTTRWDPRRENAPYIAEARRRGYTLGYCAVTLKAQPQPPSPAESLLASIQTILSLLGHYVGAFDGQSNARTTAAIVAFQKSAGLPTDGVPTEALYARMKEVLAARNEAKEEPAEPKVTGSGTGFFINPDTIVTNVHVVDGCVEVRARKEGADLGVLRVVASNKADDLAALRSDKVSTDFLRLRVDAPIKAAESILVFGYPLPSALSSSGNTTLGYVTALSGLMDDKRFIQISASIQQGNSGGPVLDDWGRLIGVIQGKLDAMTFARATGDIPQNINFAIRASTLTGFLQTNKIVFEPATATEALAKTRLAELAAAASVQLECRK